MPGRSSQRKGAEGERELAALLRGYGYTVTRGGSLSFGEVPDLTGLPGIHIEVKRAEHLNLSEAMRQAERDSDKFRNGAPAVFHRRNREPWLVTMRLHDWMALYHQQKGRKQMNVKICPLLSESGNNPFPCVKEQCGWFSSSPVGEGCCGILEIANEIANNTDTIATEISTAGDTAVRRPHYGQG